MEEVQQQIELVSKQISDINTILADPLNAWNELNEFTKEVIPSRTWWSTAEPTFRREKAALQECLTILRKRLNILQERQNLILRQQLSLTQVDSLLKINAALQQRITSFQKENAALQQVITTFQKENATIQKRQKLHLLQQFNSNQVLLTIEEYLSKSIPPTPSYKNIPGPSSTNVIVQATPSLISWDNFFAQRLLSHEVPTLHPFILDNILDPVVKPFKHLKAALFFGGSVKGEPDFVFYGNGRLLAVGEVKGFWTLPSETDLIAQYESNGYVKSAVNQLYSYLLLNHLISGVLTNYEMTWFFERRIEKNREEKLYISPGVAFSLQVPTLFQCMAYFLNAIGVDNDFQSPPQKSPARLRPTQEGFVSPLEQKLTSDDIDTGDEIASGRTGVVFLADSGLTALKTLDISKRPELVDEFINETYIYSKLKALQGKVIPNFRYCGIVEGILLIFGMDYIGEVPTKLNSNQKEKLLKGLSEIHSYGILHGDIQIENIVVDSVGNPFFIDFSLSSFENNADEKMEELISLQNLLQSF